MAAIWNRINTLLLVLVLLTLLAIVGMLAGGVRGGPLDPTAPPASTMKSLDDIPGSWSRALPANDGSPGPNPPAGCDSSRFECLEEFGNTAVLDRETGLVWQRNATLESASNWGNAMDLCRVWAELSDLGMRGGWRLPTVEELSSLMEQFAGPPTLPSGHPFVVATNDYYWTATASATTAYALRFDGFGVITPGETKSNDNYWWCVRGGQGSDGI